MSEETRIELTGEDGSIHHCRMLDLVRFEEKEYAVLLTENEDAVVIMLVIEGERGTTFRTIQDDNEFDRVLAFVQALAKSNSDEEK